MRPALLAAALSLAAAPVLAQTAAPAYGPPAAAPDYGQAAPGGYAPAPGGPAAGRPAPSPQMMAARRAMTQACAADRARLCSAPAGGAAASGPGERPMMCMRQHMSELSSGCQQAMQSMRQARQAAMASGAPASTPTPR